MSTDVLVPAPVRNRRADLLLRAGVILLELFVAVGALYGGVSLLMDTWALPSEWLEALPFDGWTIPGLLLIVLIGLPGLGAAVFEALGRRWVIPWSLAYGVGLVAWILVQILIVPFSAMQPTIAIVGLVIAAASWSRLRLART